MMVSPTCSALASLTRPGTSSAATSAFRTRGSVAVPPLPGATSTSETLGDCAHFQASACSRPPEPTMRTFTSRPQCRKWRMPVNTMHMPCSSAAAMTSSSRLLPPGCTMALMPYSAATSMPSRNGKKASEAMELPSTVRPSSLALSAATRVEYTRDICPAPTPMVMPSFAKTIALDFTYLQTRQANHRSAYWVGVGWSLLTTLKVSGCASAVSRLCTSRPPTTLRYSSSEGLAL